MNRSRTGNSSPLVLLSRLSFLLLLLSLFACVDSGGDSSDQRVEVVNEAAALQAAIDESVDSAIVPAVQDFLRDAQELRDSAEAFCNISNESNLLAVQERWKTLFQQWYRLSLYNFGPLNDDIIFPTFTFIDSLRLRGTNYLATVRAETENDISIDDPLTDEYYARKTFNRVGLLAVESVAFETSTPEHSNDPVDILAEFDAQPRKCQVLLGLTGQLESRAEQVESGWLTEFKDSGLPYRTLFLDGQLEDGTDPINQLLIASQEFLDYLQARNVVTTAAQVSMFSWEAITATVDEVEFLLRGASPASNSIFDAMVATGNQNAVAAVEDSIVQVRQAIANRDPAMLEITLGFLDGNFKREIPDSLEVELGINFSDGD
ncbi:MAG: imelysin family protein [Pseudomonadota bacterium]